jgi:iron(III) transport system permease protein
VTPAEAAAFRRRTQLTEPWIVGIATGLVVIAVIVPLVAVVARIDVASLAVLGSSRAWVLLGRSLLLATAVTAGALVLGVPLGAVFARARIPLRRALFGLHLLPLFLPPFFACLGWFHVFGVRGLAGNAGTSSVLFGPVGAWAVLVLALAPIVTALTALGIHALDPSLEEAGRIVARPVRVMARILVPAARAQIALAALTVFALSLGEIGVPMFLRVDVYPAAVFARLAGADFSPGEAAALSLPVAALAGVLTLGERRGLSSASAASLALRAPSREPLDVGPLAFALAIGGGLLSVLPLIALAAHGAPALLSVSDWIGSTVANSLVVSSSSAAIATLMALILGHALARGRRLARWMDLAAVFAFFLPSEVLGVGIVAVWNRPSTDVVYGSAAILVLGFLAHYGVLALRAFAASVSGTSVSYEDAAAAAGAGYFRRLTRVVLPMERQGIVAAFGLTMVFCLRDLETAVIFYPPGGEPLTVRIFTLEANGPTRVVAALALVHTAITASIVLALAWLLRRRIG